MGIDYIVTAKFRIENAISEEEREELERRRTIQDFDVIRTLIRDEGVVGLFDEEYGTNGFKVEKVEVEEQDRD